MPNLRLALRALRRSPAFSPLVYVTVAAVFAVVAAVACAAPSLHASRIDPLQACRAD